MPWLIRKNAGCSKAICCGVMCICCCRFRPSMPWRRWLVFLRARVPFTLRAPLEAESSTSPGQHFWARGYYVSTTGKDEEVVRRYIQEQEEADRRLDQLTLFDE